MGIWVRDGATIEDIHIHHVTGNVLKYADGVGEYGTRMWWGNGEPIFIDATYRNSEHRFPGKIRNITFDHIYMKAESSIFVAGEADTEVEHVQLTDLNITMRSQGTQKSGYFDEQPSEKNVYEHTIPAVYARYADDLVVSGRVQYEEPYNVENNPLQQVENCKNTQISMQKV